MTTSWFDSSAQRDLIDQLRGRTRRWLITGVAGFIGSNLLEALLALDQDVVGLDDFSTGHRRNLDEVRTLVGPDRWARFRMIEGDIRDRATCQSAVEGVEIILHQAALGSVPRSIDEPLTAHDVNVTGFLNLLEAARLGGVSRFIYAASSSTYGDEPTLPKREELIGAPLSPYAVTKLADELYASVYARTYGFKATGLRYFNIFGPRQDPDGAYAAVIPRWTASMIKMEPVAIFGDGETSRDFCFVANAVQANLRAALSGEETQGEVFNVAVGDTTSLKTLFEVLRDSLAKHQIHYGLEPVMEDFRSGDVRHSQADISKARAAIAYAPTHRFGEGVDEAMPWYIASE